MNQLAEMQRKLFDSNITEEEYDNRLQDFLKKYFELRQKSEKSLFGKLSIRTRKKLHPFILAMFKIKNRLDGFMCDTIADHRTVTNRPIIYAATHIGKPDIEVICEAIKDHFYLLTGEYERIQGILYEPILNINGVIYVNELVKEDRRDACSKMISILREGANLLYFPEGAWNLSPNLPVLPCYWGIVEIARKSNAIIVPIAVEQYGKHFDVNIGDYFDMQQYSDEEKGRAISDFRDVLATLKWQIWERHSKKRSEIACDEWEKYIAARYSEWNYPNLEYVDYLVYKPKDITVAEDAFLHLKKIIPKRENAFLFRR